MRFRLPLVIVTTLVPITLARAQDTVLTRLLIANRLPISIAGGRLAGAGGRLLVEAGKKSRFFLVGEEHGVNQTPEIVEALLAELRPAGYNTFAIEVSPLQAERLDGLTRRANMPAALDTLLSNWLTAVPFYTLTSERHLLTAAMSSLGTTPPMRVWGFDYDVSGDRFYLRELEQLVPSSGRAAVTQARLLADSGFAALAGQGNPSGLFAWSAPDSVFAELRKAFGTPLPLRARTIIDVFDRTARINRLFLSGRIYESNLDRSAYLRQNFIAAMATAEAAGRKPRVLFKFGGSHMMRGMNLTNTLDIGAAAPIVAEARGERSYHILVLGGPGSKTARMNILKLQYEPTGTAEIEESEHAWLRPALADGEWLVFDLAAVRLAYLKGRPRPGLTPIQDRFLHAYDAIVVLNGSTPGKPVPLSSRD